MGTFQKGHSDTEGPFNVKPQRAHHPHRLTLALALTLTLTWSSLTLRRVHTVYACAGDGRGRCVRRDVVVRRPAAHGPLASQQRGRAEARRAVRAVGQPAGTSVSVKPNPNPSPSPNPNPNLGANPNLGVSPKAN